MEKNLHTLFQFLGSTLLEGEEITQLCVGSDCHRWHLRSSRVNIDFPPLCARGVFLEMRHLPALMIVAVVVMRNLLDFLELWHKISLCPVIGRWATLKMDSPKRANPIQFRLSCY